MAIVVEHEKRKHEILQKALDVFITEGYEDATYQKIADKCGITRTTLYRRRKTGTQRNGELILHCGVRGYASTVEKDYGHNHQ